MLGTIKVLLCSPLGGKIGGIAKWTEYIMAYSQRHEDVLIEQCYNNTKTNYKGAIGRIVNGILKYFPLYQNVKARLSRQNYDVLHISSSASLALFCDFLLVRLARKYNTKSVVHFHFGRIPELFEKKNWEYKILLKVISLANAVIVIDKLSFNTLSKYGCDNVYYLPNPLSPQVKRIIDQKHVRRVPNTICFAGHMIPTKGVYELVQACRDLDKVRLLMYGSVSSAMRNELYNLAGDSCEQWLILKGERDLHEVIEAMLSCNVFVLPTYTEGFPNVIIESMACGCPIVSTNVGNIPEMLGVGQGQNCGICIQPRSVILLQNAIKFMLENKAFADECAKNAKQRVNNMYSISIVWKELVEIWRNIQ